MSDLNDAKQIGAQIRALLFSLYAPGHSAEIEKTGRHSYATDELRRSALDHAGICWFSPGEMAPGCCCDWDIDNPSQPREKYINRLQSLYSKIETLNDKISSYLKKH